MWRSVLRWADVRALSAGERFLFVSGGYVVGALLDTLMIYDLHAA